VMCGGSYALEIPVLYAAGAVDTGIDLAMTGCFLTAPGLVVDTVKSGASIDLGIGAGAETGHDQNGLADGILLDNAGWVWQGVDATAANLNAGALVVEVDIIDATGTPVYVSMPKAHPLDGVAKSLDYTMVSGTADFAGRWFQPIFGTGFYPVARVMKAATGGNPVAVRMM